MRAERRVTVEDMMLARDARLARQRAMLAAWRAPLCCLTMNIAGPVKSNEWIDAAFEEGARLAEAHFRRLGMKVLARERVEGFTGCEMYWSIRAGTCAIKQAAIAVEEADDFGRLIDLDVIGEDGVKVVRESVGAPVRRCLLCEKAAALCGRSRAHGYEALSARQREIVREHFDSEQADALASLAVRSLLDELMVTPKPGLVDRANNGSHDDMNCFTFVASAAVLTPYFRDCAAAGINSERRAPGDGSSPTLEALFQRLRYLGLQAEDAMLEATGGVNTHKGAIFSMGLICAAAGRVWAADGAASAASVCALVADMTSDTLHRELKAVDVAHARTAGERVFAATGLSGARGEAAAGFPSVIGHALPVLGRALEEKLSRNEAGVLTLLKLMAVTEDTNMVHRGSQALRQEIAAKAQLLIEALPFSMEAVRAFDLELIRAHISPGGSADLLAVTFFLHGLNHG